MPDAWLTGETAFPDVRRHATRPTSTTSSAASAPPRAFVEAAEDARLGRAPRGGLTMAGRAAARAASDPRRHPYEYAIIRVVPRVERGERLNAGVVLFCRPRRFLAARVHLDEARLRALDPTPTRRRSAPTSRPIERIARGDADAGPIARLSRPERFHWLVAPSSTIIQPSEVHPGLCSDPAAELEHLFATLVG